eukprot:INCI5878.1.p2 GENE.INCI5878.1~~INCI5878.1.p2  ORF type:complete len:486 (-),score=133.07 INCI5878.1:2240-3607(-)
MSSRDDGDGEYADLFQSSGEEFRSDEEIYTDSDSENDNTDDDGEYDDFDGGGELRVSSAIAADVHAQRSSSSSSSSKRRRSRRKAKVKGDLKKADGAGQSTDAMPEKYTDDFSGDDAEDDPHREAMLQSYIDQRLNSEDSGRCVRLVRVVLVLIVVVAGLGAGAYFSNAGVNHIYDTATRDIDDAANKGSAEAKAGAGASGLEVQVASAGVVAEARSDDAAAAVAHSKPTKKEILLKKKEKQKQQAPATSSTNAGSVRGAKDRAAADESAEAPPPSRKLQFKVVTALPHNKSDFTEGLEFHPKSGMLVECTGIKRSSGVKLLQPAVDDSPSNTLGGAIGKAPELVASQNLEDKYFGEGCTVFNDKLFELTYKSQQGFVYDATTLERISSFSFTTTTREGWGMTHDRNHLIVSDGSNVLAFWDPNNPGKIIKTLVVSGTIAGQKVTLFYQFRNVLL